MRLSRREFLKATGAGTLLAGVPAGWAGVAYAQAAETPRSDRHHRPTDCSSIVMAHSWADVTSCPR